MNKKRVGGIYVAVLSAACTLHALSGFDLGVQGAQTVAQDLPKTHDNRSGRSSDKQLDAWINQALVEMKKRGIPGTYQGLHKNIIRESGGDPTICNMTDINAQNGTPSCGLLQVIQPTFDENRCEGLPNQLTHPIANLCAAANYAARRYGSIDNVNGPY